MVDINVGKLVPVEALNKFYEDAISPSAKQIGKLGEDVLKTARIILAPVQVAAAFQSRFEVVVERIAQRIPAERRIDPPAEVVGPVLEGLRFIDGDSPLSAMFEEILSNAIDSEGQNLVHPAFPHIVKQMSRDEAWIIYRLRDGDFKVVDRLNLDIPNNRFYGRIVEYSELPIDELYTKDQIELLFSHLQALGLVEWPITDQEPIMSGNQQTGLRRKSTMKLTELGRLFVGATIPSDGFERFRKAK